MCDNCKDNKQDQCDSEIKASPLSSDSDPILFFEPLELTTDNLAEDINIQLDKTEFIRGLKDASYACGMYTALINCGMSMEDSIGIIMNKMNVDHNILMSRIQADGSIEVSKNTSILKEKDML
jgi:hypothetical protein